MSLAGNVQLGHRPTCTNNMTCSHQHILLKVAKEDKTHLDHGSLLRLQIDDSICRSTITSNELGNPSGMSFGRVLARRRRREIVVCETHSLDVCGLQDCSLQDSTKDAVEIACRVKTCRVVKRYETRRLALIITHTYILYIHKVYTYIRYIHT
jgi:hypothetical protein